MDQDELARIEARLTQDGGGSGGGKRKGKGPKAAAALKAQLGPRYGLGEPKPQTVETPPSQDKGGEAVK
jgi:hypothetical protein